MESLKVQIKITVWRVWHKDSNRNTQLYNFIHRNSHKSIERFFPYKMSTNVFILVRSLYFDEEKYGESLYCPASSLNNSLCNFSLLKSISLHLSFDQSQNKKKFTMSKIDLFNMLFHFFKWKRGSQGDIFESQFQLKKPNNARLN